MGFTKGKAPRVHGGEILTVKVVDFGRRCIYRNNINLRDKKALKALLDTLISFSGHTWYDIVVQEVEEYDWTK